MSVTSVTFPVRGMDATVRWGTSFSSKVVRSSNICIEWAPDKTVQAGSKSAMPVVMSTKRGRIDICAEKTAILLINLDKISIRDHG